MFRREWSLTISLVLSIIAVAVVSISAWYQQSSRSTDLCIIAKDNRTLLFNIIRVFEERNPNSPQFRRVHELLAEEPQAC